MYKISFIGTLILMVILIACSEKKTPKEYFDAGYENYNNEKYQEALANFKIVVEDYPESEHHANAMFMMGFINANHVENYEEAKKYYQLFIEKYPNEDLAASAKYELDTLGKDIEDLDIFKKIEEEEKKDSAN